jgi:hypothetical protein
MSLGFLVKGTTLKEKKSGSFYIYVQIFNSQVYEQNLIREIIALGK